jgi:Arc/MetJ-type ribon-helix-helix transcriptional regulator
MDREIKITVSDEVARMIEEQLALGTYTSTSEVVEAAMLQLTLAEDATEPIPDDVLRALIGEVDDDGPWFTTEEVHQHLLEHHERHLAVLAAKKSEG